MEIVRTARGRIYEGGGAEYTKVEGQIYEGGGADTFQNLIKYSTLQRQKPPKAFKAIKAFNIAGKPAAITAAVYPAKRKNHRQNPTSIY